MNSSYTFIFRDVNGKGVEGKSIKLRSAADNFGSDLPYNVSPISGKSGAYVVNSDIPFDIYKAWVDGVEDKSFGGDFGKPMGNPFTIFATIASVSSSVSALNTSITNLSNSLNTSVANLTSSISTGLAAKAGLSANNTFTGINTFQQVTTIVAPIATDYADPDLDSTPNNLITNARLEYKIAHIQGYAESPNFLRVAPGIGAQAGKVYPDIQSAVTAFSSPSVNNICKCFIQGMGNNTNFIAPAYQCMKSFVNLIAADRGIVISFPNVNSSEKVTIENATVLLGAGEYSGGSGSARIWTNVKFINCTIYHFKNFTVRGGLLERCNIISPDGINFTADKDGSNIFTDIIGCTFRVPPAITDEAHYNGATDYTVIPALSIISDYTLNVPIEQ
ncbi:MAG: hypothetical protein K1X86_12570 [Ignavibacteria bacterium]|nr:hypothetical protein [Ignavibacteria bacterium]